MRLEQVFSLSTHLQFLESFLYALETSIQFGERVDTLLIL